MKLHDRILAGLTGVLLLAAGARLVGRPEPPRVVWPELPRLAAPAVPPAGKAPAALEQALSGNVFSASRTPPAVRFQPGFEPGSPVGGADPPSPPTASPPPHYRVAGTMMAGPEAGFALIDANPATPAPEVYRVGDAVGAYRLERIAYDHVVLVGAAGEVRMPISRPAARTRASWSGEALPQGTPSPPVPIHQRATSSANTPPGAIPAGW